MSRRVLFLTVPPIEAAGTRYRVVQYLPALRAAGIEGELRPLISSAAFATLYRRGDYAHKLAQLLGATVERLVDVAKARRYDAVFIAREAMMFGPPLIEWLMAKLAGRPLVFDFDDAIWVAYDSPTYGSISRMLRPPGKTARIIGMSARVIAGNDYLADYARRFNEHVTVIPTVVDDESYAAVARSHHEVTDQPLVIGWVGTHSTAQYLKLIAPALTELARRYHFLFRVVGGPDNFAIPGVAVDNRPWRLESELDNFRGIDIGVYPIIEDAWSLGKCAFKAIQFMAAGIPSVNSPVGMTREVVTDGIDGLLADSTEEWTAALERLIVDAALRRQFSEAGLKTIRARYSLRAHAPRFVESISSTIGQC